MSHTPLPPQEDDPHDTTNAKTVIPVETRANARQQIIDDLANDDELLHKMLMRPDLTQIIARLGLYEHFKHKMLMAEPVPERAVFKIGGDSVYLIVVRLTGHSMSSVSLLVHSTKFQPAELNVMVAEATRITNRVRIDQRRKTLAENKTRIDDYDKTSQNFFESDVEFFEAVMLDKYQFKKLLTHNTGTEIEPTVKKEA